MHISFGQQLVGLLAVFSTASALSTTVADADITGASTNVSSTFSTSVTGTRTSTPLPNPLEKRAPSPSNLACYNIQKNCKNNEVYEGVMASMADGMCQNRDIKEVVAGPDFRGVGVLAKNKYWLSYNVKILWKSGCTMPEGTMRIDEPGYKVSCAHLVKSTWNDCNNGGRGGSIDYGCLQYHFNIINGEEAGNGYCRDIPFGNYTG
ncbi:hypothetical protein KVR01_012480 [Diaporthe batatas]|uniref:uncharacterized protein n=1 Tax=Diaporthe batatas TaxID=748121 RepID=UPI001D03A227|nr:uncharacterized protein KVR01_012480 [Diaporthe batatas]KAG8157818.1 hypothetical protein KVR01_012480 [Diaporthe batatas]